MDTAVDGPGRWPAPWPGQRHDPMQAGDHRPGRRPGERHLVRSRAKCRCDHPRYPHHWSGNLLLVSVW